MCVLTLLINVEVDSLEWTRLITWVLFFSTEKVLN